MEKAYKFIQITLLGLILGVMIVFLFRVNYWAHDIKMTIRKSVVYQNKEYIKEDQRKKMKKPPACQVPNEPKYKI